MSGHAFDKLGMNGENVQIIGDDGSFGAHFIKIMLSSLRSRCRSSSGYKLVAIPTVQVRAELDVRCPFAGRYA